MRAGAEKGHGDQDLTSEGGADVNKVDENGWTGSSCTQQRRVRATGDRDTLERGADVNAAHKGYGWTALTYAAGKGHVETVTLLLGCGADVNKANGNDQTAHVRSRWPRGAQTLLLERGWSEQGA